MGTVTAEGRPIYLVGCGARKHSRPMPARDLYQGGVFRACRAYAEARGTWYILSARHGLVPPDAILSPYNERLRGYRGPRKGRCSAYPWAVRTLAELMRREGDGPLRLVCLAGQDYAGPLAEVLAEMSLLPWVLDCPMHGLGVGQRLAWLAREARVRAWADLVSDAAEAAEVIDADELEAHAAKLREG